MKEALIAFGVPIGIAAQPVLHPGAQIGLGGPEQEVDVVGHPAIGEDLPGGSPHLVGQSLREPIVMPFVMEHGFFSVPSGHDMINGAWKLQSRGTSHTEIP